MATRALAAEIRQDSARITSLIEARCRGAETPLGELVDVRCEDAKAGRIDLILEYESSAGNVRRVGVEAKFDHEITATQLKAESEKVDLLILLVADVDDAKDHRQLVGGVVTWREVLGCFTDARLTLEDVASMPLTKRRIERILAAHTTRFPQGNGWDIRTPRGGSGIPSIAIESPELPDGRRLRGQIQMVGRKAPADPADARFEYHIGIQVDNSDDDLPDADEVETAPAWVPHLQTLRQVLGKISAPDLRISKRAASAGRTPRGRNKLPLVEKFLDGESWLAKGYTDGWALGIKSTKAGADELGELCDIAAAIFEVWYQTESGSSCLGVGSAGL